MDRLSFTFLGVVYNPQPLSEAPGLENFGYRENERIRATLEISGAALAAFVAGAGQGKAYAITVDARGGDFTFAFPQPQQGDYDESEFQPEAPAFAPVRIVAGGPGPALLDVSGTLFAGGDGANGYLSMPSFGGARFNDDNDAAARVEGVWLPEGAYGLFFGDDGRALKGTQAVNLLWGLEGNDRIEIKSGMGYAWGGLGDDRFKGDDDADFFWGGSGNDVALGRGGDDRLFGQEGDDELRGERGHDLLVGGFGNDTLKGGSGDDVLLGGWDADLLNGNDGADVLLSGAGGWERGRDRLDGGSGDDVLWGQEIADLKGGPGSDLFIFAVTPSGIGNANVPRDVTILEFDRKRDTIAIQLDGESAPTGPSVSDFQTLMSFAEDFADGVRFDFGSRGVLALSGVRAAQLSADDFLFDLPPIPALEKLLLLPSTQFDLLV